MSEAVTTLKQDNTRSSLFERLPPDLRRALDVAIAERVPPTFRAVWMQFELAKFGVSFTAFYRYARRLRDRVNLVEAAELAREEDAEIDAVLKKLAGRRALDLLLHSKGSDCLKEIAALVGTHSQGAWLEIAKRRLALNHDRLAEESHLGRARLEHDREQLRLKAEALELARRALENRLAQAQPLRLACSNDDADDANADPHAAEKSEPRP